MGVREAATHSPVPSNRPSDSGDGGLTHRGALSTSSSFRTSHTSRTLRRKKGDSEAQSSRPQTPESQDHKDAALST